MDSFSKFLGLSRDEARLVHLARFEKHALLLLHRNADPWAEQLLKGPTLDEQDPPAFLKWWRGLSQIRRVQLDKLTSYIDKIRKLSNLIASKGDAEKILDAAIDGWEHPGDLWMIPRGMEHEFGSELEDSGRPRGPKCAAIYRCIEELSELAEARAETGDKVTWRTIWSLIPESLNEEAPTYVEQWKYFVYRDGKQVIQERDFDGLMNYVGETGFRKYLTQIRRNRRK